MFCQKKGFKNIHRTATWLTESTETVSSFQLNNNMNPVQMSSMLILLASGDLFGHNNTVALKNLQKNFTVHVEQAKMEAPSDESVGSCLSGE